MTYLKTSRQLGRLPILKCKRNLHVQVWLLKGKTDDMYRAMWEKAMDETIAQLIFNKGNLTYIAELQKCAKRCCCLH